MKWILGGRNARGCYEGCDGDTIKMDRSDSNGLIIRDFHTRMYIVRYVDCWRSSQAAHHLLALHPFEKHSSKFKLNPHQPSQCSNKPQRGPIASICALVSKQRIVLRTTRNPTELSSISRTLCLLAISTHNWVCVARRSILIPSFRSGTGTCCWLSSS